jgi:hypothetical protein
MIDHEALFVAVINVLLLLLINPILRVIDQMKRSLKVGRRGRLLIT